MSRAAAVRDYQVEQDLVSKYATMVKRIARNVMSRLPACVQLDDLEQAGLIGLMEAVRLYDSSRGASFETYATIRIRGAIIDELRRNDWSPRSLSRRVRQLSQATSSIENDKGCAATPQEIAGKLNISLDEYHQWVLAASNQNFSSLSVLEESDQAFEFDTDSTYSSVEHAQRCDYLSEAITALPDREQMILSLYYEKDLTLKEIGEVLGVSESRVCQIHGEATLRLRSRMGDWH